LQLATEPYRSTGNFNYRWARGKLRFDPVFTCLLDQGVIPDRAEVLDLGCGRGLLGAWFLAAERLADRESWSGGAPPPRQLRFRGVELNAREAECGNRALQPIYGDRLALAAGDLRDAKLQPAEVIVMLDVLHYISYEEQDSLLDRIRTVLGRGGLFVTRVGNASGSLRFRFTQITDRCAALAQGRRLSPTWCRPLAAWIAALESRGFSVQAQPMSVGTLFANVMLVSRVT
jgi:SAM-dependent methyltransferase